MSWPRRGIDPRESLYAQFRALAQEKSECNPDSAEVLTLLWRIDRVLDRFLAYQDRPVSTR